jgi:uncharacterized membrane protein YebE (DUF533 family)
LPPARKWDSRLFVEISRPALTAMIFASTIILGGTFLNRMKIILSNPTLAPETRAWIQRETEEPIKYKSAITAITRTNRPI